MPQTDEVKQRVAAHWNRRAPGFDNDFGHSIRTTAERAAWDRILDLVVGARPPLDALDVGCGTGFLSLELATRGHRVTGIDFAPQMLAEARKKAAEQRLAVRFEEGDAEALAFPDASFDLVMTRHVLWTLPHPERAIDEWIRVLRPGGRLTVMDSQFDPSVLEKSAQNARSSAEYATIGDRLPFLGGRPQAEIEALFRAHGLAGVAGDAVPDLVEAQAQRMAEEGLEVRVRRRYIVWGDKPTAR
ncbi:MAG: class I SAM-dependent methyltransferase [Alphaproteobacteria bacterium]|nr:class I SAM-dependent methyltransferase [Alphaproteobacteria bacterium]MBV9964305.1 class I SAM-dependent methyltransferase [Alphaproteobacteria bacterium]